MCRPLAAGLTAAPANLFFIQSTQDDQSFLNKIKTNLPQMLVAVVFWLVGTGIFEPEILRLWRGKLRQMRPKFIEMQCGDLLVEMFRQHVHLVPVLAMIGPQLDLGEDLVSE